MNATVEDKKQTTLYWKNKFGLFRTILWDNKITSMTLLKEGSSMESSGFRLYEHNIDFLKEVYNAIGETVNYIENNEKK